MLRVSPRISLSLKSLNGASSSGDDWGEVDGQKVTSWRPSKTALSGNNWREPKDLRSGLSTSESVLDEPFAEDAKSKLAAVPESFHQAYDGVVSFLRRAPIF